MRTEERAIRHIPASLNQLAAKLAGSPVEAFKVVSLFSGCGGMDLGFLGGFGSGRHYYDRLPFEITWANDLSPAACKTYEENLKSPIIQGDINAALQTLPKTGDVLIGGFPCQDVSINGSIKLAEGGRTILYQEMIKAIRKVKPRIFVAENVKGLQQAHGREFFDRMLADFDLPGYTVNHRLYSAADYGAPQMRERIFIVGVRGRREFKHPEATGHTMTALEALGDLEDEPENPAISHIWSKAVRSPDQGDRKLIADRPATTIRAEHHGNVQWHYRLPRRISLREAARLQTFPDSFKFLSGMRETERLIGNAVPPVVAWHVAKAVREHLEHSGV